MPELKRFTAATIDDIEMSEKERDGCHVRITTGFILIFLALILALGVGLIVHFVEKDNSNPSPTGFGNEATSPISPEKLTQQCMNMVEQDTNKKICKACPASSTCPSVMSGRTTVPTVHATSAPPITEDTDVRLPSTLKPLTYDLEIQPNLYGNDPKAFNFNGKVEIKIACLKPTNNITLHAKKLRIDQESVKFRPEVSGDSSYGKASFVSMTTDEAREFQIFALSDNLVVGKNYILEMSFSGPLTSDLKGLYLSTYQENGQTRYLATTQFQPTDARKAFPCFDEPGMKAKFSISVVRKKGWQSLSNLNRIRTTARGGDMEVDIYAESPEMSTYLVAFVVSQFKGTSALTSRNITYGAWAQPASVNQTLEALQVGVKVIDFYEKFFDIDFPLPKQDMIAIPDYPLGAMENWGLITYRETAMLFDPLVSNENNRQRVTVVIAHEVSHQWFGNLVTMGWWDDLWLNEGFATFIEYLGSSIVHPDWQMLEQFTVLDVYKAFTMDGLRTSHPIYVPVNNPDEINEIFDSISYSKGGSVVRMIRFFLGEDTFLRGLQGYLKAKKYKNAFHDDLWSALQTVATNEGKILPATVKEIMDTWISQMNYPVVTVTQSRTGVLHLEQKRFLIDDTPNPNEKFTSPFNYVWKIPFTYTTSEELDFNKTDKDVKWVTTQSQEFQDNFLPNPYKDGAWILGNVQQYGFYRVNYERGNWIALINQLKTDHTRIPDINRGQIINDAWNLARAGQVDMDVALQTVEYLDKELGYVPWIAAKRELGYLSDMISRTELYGDFQKFMKAKVEAPFKKLTLDDRNSTHMETLLRTQIAMSACAYGVAGCVAQATKLFAEWMQNPDNNPIDPDIKGTVYCTGVREGGESEWNFALEQFKKTEVVSEKSLLLSALSCTKIQWLLSHYLTLSLDETVIRRQDTVGVIIDISRNSIGKYLAWSFVTENWDLLRNAFGGGFFSFSNLVKGITETFNTQNELEQLNQFVATHRDLGTGERAFQQAIENTQSNIKWMNKTYDAIKTWLQKVTAKSQMKEKKNVRLPRAVVPTSYEIEIRPDIYGNDPEMFKFYGNVKIHLDCNMATSNITLHINKLRINQSSIVVKTENINGASKFYERYGEDKERQFMIAYLKSPLMAGQRYVLEMQYEGDLADDLAGVYRSFYQRDGNPVYMATTQMEPTDARKTFPCFDEPDLKARFQLIILRKPPKISLSNMPLSKEENRENGYVADVYSTSQKMSTYLVCFVVCDFKGITGRTKNNITYGAWARPESIDQAKLALEIGMETITFYEDFFGIKFPLPKQDMIAIPDFSAGAMENWGLITYRETAMLYQPGVSSASNKQRVTTVITHELAHQWFGDLVTMKWWDDLWLNEGFATFVEYLGADHKYPDWKMFEQFSVGEVQSAFDFDSLVTSHPIYAPVADPAEINEIFDTISYSKGASIIRMMRWFLGEDTFKNGLKRYLNNRKFSNARHDDLWNAMAQQATADGGGRVTDVKDIMDTWTLQMNYPVVHVRLTTPTRISVTQKRFLQNPQAKDPAKYQSPYGYTWRIPFTFTTGSSLDFNQTWQNINWVTGKSKAIQVTEHIDSTNWILANIQQYGYYRVNYDRSNWMNLITQLKTQHQSIHPINRGQLINDAWSLAKSGDLDMDIALKVIEYLGEEMDYVPWYAARKQLSYVQRMLSRTTLYGKLEKYLKTLLQAPFKKYGMDNTGASHIEMYTRSLLVGEACDYGITECTQGALRMYRDWMSDPVNKRVDPDLKSTVYCTGIAEGGEAEWNFAYQQYKLSNVAGEKSTLMAALGCSRETWILSRYLEYSINPKEIRKQDGSKVIGYISRSPVGRDLAWNFVRENFQTLLNMYGSAPFAMKNLLNGVTPSFNSDLDLQQLRDLQTQYPDMGTGTRAFQQIIEKTELNNQWVKRNYHIIESWLDDNLKAKVEVSDVRLPKNVKPFFYEVEIFPDIYQNDPKDFMFQGYVKIWFRTLEATSNITLHINKLTVDTATIAVGTNGSMVPPGVRSTSEDKDRQFFIIQMDDLLEEDTVYFVVMNYTGPLTDDLAGLYYSSYKRGEETVYIATTQMEATDARKALPCFDEPALKAKFQVTLVRRSDRISLANMPVERTENRENNMVADIYETSETMSTYLLCFIVCDFKEIQNRTRTDTLYGAWARPESIGQADLALGVGTETLAFYEEYFNIRFPLPKQDMIAIPDFAAGAMENWGLITYRETAMLYQPGVSSASNKQRVVIVITHELAHQWFGDLVTMEWWDDLWLNEGFATFVEYLGADHMFPDWKMFEQFTVNEIQSAFDFDGLVTSHPIYVPVANPSEISEIFDSISYAKGASVIRMMKHFVGDTVFRTGLTNYLNSRRLGNAFHDDLWFAIGNESIAQGNNLDVKGIMDTWILQMNYPVVTVTRNGRKLRLTQKRFLIDYSAQDPKKYTSPFDYVWRIPFTYTTSQEKNFYKTFKDVIWFDTKEKDIDANIPSGGWIIANVEQYGYYRVNYDADNWAAIINQLNANHKLISDVNRAQVINDAWTLSKSGDLAMGIALNTVNYLKNELDYVPWSAASGQLAYVRIMLERTALYGKFKNFMQELISKPFSKLGLDNTGAPHIEKFTRSLVAGIACKYDVESCVTESVKLYKQWMDDPVGKRVDPDIKSTVYCTGIAEGGEEQWDFAYKQYKTTDVAAEQKTLLSALACTQETWLLNRYLNMALDENEVRKQDAVTVIVYVSRNTIGRDLVWQFVQEHWETLRRDYGGGSFSFSNLFDGIFESFNTELELQQLRDFEQAHPDLGSGQRAFQQAIEKTESNIKWMKNNLPIVEQWLNNVTNPNTNVKRENLRLPRAVMPELYDLELYPDLYQPSPKDFRFYGNVSIIVNCSEATNNITLHAHRLTIDDESLEINEYDNVPKGDNLFLNMSLDEDKQFLILNLRQSLQPGKQYYIYIKFDGPLIDDLAGLYYSTYKSGNKIVYMATTQMEPTDARKTFPCFDEPDLKARFQLTILRKPPKISLSNMPLSKEENRENGYVADVYSTSQKMSTYLVCFVVCDFKGITGRTKNNITYGAWARPESIDQAKLALEIGMETITFYEDFFGIKFPLPKQDMIAIPDFSAGAMENWGLITYRETAMLYQPGVSSASNKQRVTTVITHELAHQWFGDLVTMKWWDDLWLNEGFATFVEYLGADHKYPDWKMFEQFSVGEVQSAFDFDGLVTSHPIYAPVADPAEINEIFDTISYSKGASIIRMMRWFLGEDTFKNGLKRYLNNRKFSNARHDDLWNAMAQQATADGGGRVTDVKDIMDTWTLQMNYPVVHVRLTTPTRISVTQKRFLQNPQAKDPAKYQSPYGYTWRIPFTFTTGSSLNFNQTWQNINWVTGKSKALQVTEHIDSTNWILANIQQYGYYRVNYDRSNWMNLITQLKTQHQSIHPINRGQLINDAWSLAKSGDLDMDIALKVIEYLGEEMDYVPWYAARKQLSYVQRMLSRTTLYGKLEKYLKTLLQAPFKKYGMDNTGASHIEMYTRSLLVGEACDYGITECTQGALRMYRDWMSDPVNKRVDPDLKSTVYCTGIAEGGEAEWNFAYQQYKLSNVAGEKSTLMAALGCSRETWILSRYLEYSINPKEIRKQDGSKVIGYISRSPVGRDLAWNFVRENFQTLLNMYGSAPFAMKNLLNGVTPSFNSDLDLQQLRDLQTQYPDMGTGTRAFQQIIEKTELNNQWVKRNYHIIESWLDDNLKAKVEVSDVRLPKNVKPFYYEVEIFPDIYQNDPKDFMFQGYVKIWFRTLEATSNITLHINKLTVDTATVAVGTNGSMVPPGVRSTSEDKDRQFFIIQMDDLLEEDTVYFVVMNYTGPLTDDLAGLYYSSYKRGEESVYIATTQMEATDARKALPCFDEPALKAKFKVTLVRRSDRISLANMPVERTENRENNMVADIYETSETMSTYLLCFIVCDFKEIQNRTRTDTLYGAWARPESIGQADLALGVGTETLAFYEEYFNISFPLPKQNMIAIPDFAAGAMENWGLITYRETAMLYQPGVSSASNKQRVVIVITHELAHQWFGDLVTMEWWDDLWLNEGFATFVEYLGADHMYPDWKMFEQFTVNEIQSAFDFDGLVTSHPIYVPVANPSEISEIFDSISYAKGASVIRMMKHFVGDTVFRTGLKNYLNSRRLGNAFHDDLWFAIGNESIAQGNELDVKGIMDTWILQMNYPVVTVTRNGGKLRLTQKRFLIDYSAQDPKKYISPFDYVWRIPFTYTTSQEQNFNKTFKDVIWFDTKEKDIDANIPSGGWIIANVEQYGYYRVNYDADNWAAIINQLNANHKLISDVNRAQVINDAWTLSKSGDLAVGIALNTVNYLKNELDYVPWSAASGQLAYVRIMLERTALYGKFKNFMQELISKPFSKLGLDNTGAPHIEKFTRSLVAGIACKYDVESCVTESVKLYKQWMDDPVGKRVDPDIKSSVYCTGIAEGGEEQWDFAYNQYKTTDVAAEQKTLLSALACTQETWLLNRYLNMALDENEVRKQDAVTVIVYVSRNTIGRDLVWQFVQEHWETLRRDYGGGSFSFSNLFDGIFESFNTELELQQLRDFEQAHPDLGSGQRAFQQAIEKTESNIKWMKNNLPIVEQWLNNVTNPNTNVKRENLRLPRAVMPDLYDLELYPDLYQPSPKDFRFYGNVSIIVNCSEATNNITLHAHRLTIDDESLEINEYNNGPKGDNLFLSMSLDEDKQFLILNLKQSLQPDKQYYIYIKFDGPLTDDLAGLYYSTYKRGNNTVYIATTQMEPADARKALPCFDEPDMKAKFKVTLVRKSNMKSLSNMPIERTESRLNSLVADICQESPRMSTYLLAFIVCDFNKSTTTTKNNITYSVWAIPEALSQANLALNLGKQIITFYEEYFGIKFPLPKQDMIAIPDFRAGAMENWGLITYRETAMLFEPGVSSEGNRQRVAIVIAHELAHMWFGDLVTMQWWDDIWLNEGFAAFVEYLGTDHVYPDWKMFEQFVREEIHMVLSLDSSVNSHPIYVPIDTVDMLHEVFDGISYGKGASVIRMMRFFLGENTFKHGIHNYLNGRRYQNAFHDDLWDALDKQARSENGQLPATVKEIMNTWTLQMNYPLVTMTTPTRGHITVTQERFLKNPEAKDPGRYTSPYGYKWWVPFTYTTSTEVRFNKTNTDIHWFNDTTKDIYDQSINVDSSDFWVIGNTMQYGLYRVNYTEKNWRALIKQLNDDHKVISPINRAQIIDDAWNLARSNQLSMDIALKTVDYLAKERDYIPRITGEEELGYMDLMLRMTKHYGKYKKFRQDLITPIYKELGFNNTGAAHLESYMRSHVVSTACDYDVEACVEEAKRQFNEWMSQPQNNRIDPGVKYTVYCTGIRKGGEKEWDFAYSQYKSSPVASERAKLLSALSCTEVPWLLERFLEYAITSSEVRKQDGTSVISSVGRSVVGKPIAWKFLREKWQYIYVDYSDRQWNMGSPLSSVASSFNTEFELQQLRDFGGHVEFGRAERTYRQIQETIQSNIQWMNKNINIIENWLNSHK